MNTKSIPQNSEILFQKLGNTWYVFTEIDNDVVYSTLPHGVCPKSTRIELYEVIEEHLAKVSRHHRSTPDIAA